MEEDIEKKPCMFHDSLALQAYPINWSNFGVTNSGLLEDNLGNLGIYVYIAISYDFNLVYCFIRKNY
jgi:hypothetical protein